jgi:hypothetical protein
MKIQHSLYGLLFTFCLILTCTEMVFSASLGLSGVSSSTRDTVSVTLILDAQLKLSDVYPVIRDKNPRERRKWVVQALKSLAEQSQANLKRDLENIKNSTRYCSYKSLWITNTISATLEKQDLIAILNSHPEINRVNYYNHVSSPIGNPKPPLTDKRRSADEIGWGIVDLHVPEVWDCGFCGAGTTIALLDVGVDYNHPDLANHIWINPGEDVNGNGVVDSADWNGVDDDHNGYIDDLRGWSFANNSPEVMDDLGYGTASAGILCGDGSSGTQTGVAPQAKLMILKDFLGSEIDYYEAQQYATEMGADLICSSICFKWSYVPHPDYAALRHNSELELAAGLIHLNTIGEEGDNQNTNPIPFNIAAPANCPPPWLHPDQTLIGDVSATLGVGCFDTNHQLTAYSSRGAASWYRQDIINLDPGYPWGWEPNYNDYPYLNGQQMGLIKPDLCGPVGVISTALGGGYCQLSDHYAAANAHIAGLTALLFGAAPFSNPETLAEVILTTCADMGTPGKDNLWGCGIPNAFSALSELLSSSYGGLAGAILDSITLAPIVDAAISIPSLSRTTHSDSTGHFSLLLIPAGNHDVCFSAIGYDTLWIMNQNFEPGQIDTLNVTMLAPHIWLGISEISTTLNQGEQQTSPIPIRNTGGSPLNITFDRGGDWLPYQTFATIPAENLCGDNQLYGVEVANGHLWVSGGNSGSEPNKLYVFSFEGEWIKTLDQPPGSSPLGWRDLAWDGAYLYGSSGTQVIGIDLEGNIQATIEGPLQNHSALAYNPSSDQFIACDDTSNIIEFSRTGSITHTWGHSLHVRGLAWHPSDPDNCPLYIFSTSTDEDSSQLQLSKMNLNEGVIQWVTNLPAASGESAGGVDLSGEIDCDCWGLVGLVQGAEDEIRCYSLNAYAPYLSITPSSQTIQPGITFSASALLNAQTVPAGEYHVNLLIRNNSPEPIITIPVSLNVQPSSVNDPGDPVLPNGYRVEPAFPNPFNSETVLPIVLTQSSHVTVELFDLGGRKVRTLFSGFQPAGRFQLSIKVNEFASGVYFYRFSVSSGSTSAIGKLVLLK